MKTLEAPIRSEDMDQIAGRKPSRQLLSVAGMADILHSRMRTPKLGLDPSDTADIFAITDSVSMPDFGLSRVAVARRASAPVKSDAEGTVTDEQIRKLEELYAFSDPVWGAPSNEMFGEKPAEKPAVVIVDDETDPANGVYINQSLIDLPPQWMEFIQEADQETEDAGQPLGLRLKSTYQAVISRIEEKMQPVLMPGAEALAILESPEPLTDQEIEILLLDKNKKFASLFMTICLTLQSPQAILFAPESAKTEPLHPGTPLIIPEQEPVATTIQQIINEPVAPTVFDQDAESKKAPETTIPTLEDWQKVGEFFPRVKTVENEYALAEKAAVLKAFQDNPELIQVYKKAQDATGVPLEFFAGIHHREGNMNINGSFISGRRIGTPEPDAGYRVFGSLAETAIYGGELLKNKSGQEIKTAQQWVKVLSRYNGGGNRNWGRTDYPHEPPFEGSDDPYVMNFFDEEHGGEGSEMYVRYCEDGRANTKGCPRVDYRAGVYAVAIWVHEFIQSGQIEV